MDQAGAREESRRRWGGAGRAVVDDDTYEAAKRRVVGYVLLPDGYFLPQGRGATWEEAFAAADAKAANDDVLARGGALRAG